VRSRAIHELIAAFGGVVLQFSDIEHDFYTEDGPSLVDSRLRQYSNGRQIPSRLGSHRLPLQIHRRFGQFASTRLVIRPQPKKILSRYMYSDYISNDLPPEHDVPRDSIACTYPWSMNSASYASWDHDYLVCQDVSNQHTFLHLIDHPLADVLPLICAGIRRGRTPPCPSLTTFASRGTTFGKGDCATVYSHLVGEPCHFILFAQDQIRMFDEHPSGTLVSSSCTHSFS
jgi:hypothetical protein